MYSSGFRDTVSLSPFPFPGTTSLFFSIDLSFMGFARSIQGEKYWAIRLLAIACLSLAAKMEECRVPLLSEFPGEDYNFEGKVIRRMEILLLDTLEWRMAIATPCTFTPYFVSKLCKNNQMRDAVSRVIEIIPVAIRSKFIFYF